MDDLAQLNRRIAEHWLGRLDSDQDAYLSYLSVCLGELPYSAAELGDVLARSKLEDHDPLDIAKLNLRYLNFARLAAKDIEAGRLEMLIKLGITLEQVEVLGNMTDEDVRLLAFIWDGPIVRFDSQAFTRGATLHVGAARHHAAAYITTHSATTHK